MQLGPVKVEQTSLVTSPMAGGGGVKINSSPREA